MHFSYSVVWLKFLELSLTFSFIPFSVLLERSLAALFGVDMLTFYVKAWGNDLILDQISVKVTLSRYICCIKLIDWPGTSFCSSSEPLSKTNHQLHQRWSNEEFFPNPLLNSLWLELLEISLTFLLHVMSTLFRNVDILRLARSNLIDIFAYFSSPHSSKSHCHFHSCHVNLLLNLIDIFN